MEGKKSLPNILRIGRHITTLSRIQSSDFTPGDTKESSHSPWNLRLLQCQRMDLQSDFPHPHYMKSSSWQKPDVCILLKSWVRSQHSRARHAEQEELHIIHSVQVWRKTAFSLAVTAADSVLWLTLRTQGSAHAPARMCSGGFQHVLVWLLLTAERKGFLHKLPAHGALLEVAHTAVAQAGMPARQQHPVHAPVLAHHTVLAALLHWLHITPSQSCLLQQALLGISVCWGGPAGGTGAAVCRHEKLL